MSDLLDTLDVPPAAADSAGGVDALTNRPVAPVAMAATLGQSLAVARQARGLSIDEVAQAIKFGVRQIAAVEQDDFSKLPGTTMVRGFIRSYAKLLQIDPVALLALYDQQVPASIAAISVLPEVDAPLSQFGGRSNPLFRYWLASSGIVVLLLAVVAYFFWQPLPFSMPTTVLSAESDHAATNQSEAENARRNAMDSTLPAAVIESPASPMIAPATAAPLPVANPAAVLDSPSAALSAEASQAATAAADPDIHRLTFDFDEAAWVEVKDATAKVIFAQNNLPRSQQVVSGRPPFAVVVGNASHVRLRYEDRQVDLRPYTRVDVARFNLE
jgi:cytoskeleton protein RodZ